MKIRTKTLAFIVFLQVSCRMQAIATPADLNAEETQEKPVSKEVYPEWHPYPGSIQLFHSVEPSVNFVFPVNTVINERKIRAIAIGGGVLERDKYRNPSGVSAWDIKEKYKTELQSLGFTVRTDCEGEHCKLVDRSAGLGLPVNPGEYYLVLEKIVAERLVGIAIHVTSEVTYMARAEGPNGGHVPDTSFGVYDFVQTAMDGLIVILVIVVAVYQPRWKFPAIVIPCLSVVAFAVGEWAVAQEHLVAPIRVDLLLILPVLLATLLLGIAKQVQQVKFQSITVRDQDQ